MTVIQTWPLLEAAAAAAAARVFSGTWNPGSKRERSSEPRRHRRRVFPNQTRRRGHELDDDDDSDAAADWEIGREVRWRWSGGTTAPGSGDEKATLLASTKCNLRDSIACPKESRLRMSVCTVLALSYYLYILVWMNAGRSPTPGPIFPSNVVLVFACACYS